MPDNGSDEHEQPDAISTDATHAADATGVPSRLPTAKSAGLWLVSRPPGLPAAATNTSRLNFKQFTKSNLHFQNVLLHKPSCLRQTYIQINIQINILHQNSLLKFCHRLRHIRYAATTAANGAARKYAAPGLATLSAILSLL